MDPRTPERVTIINPNADFEVDGLDDFDFPDPDDDDDFDIGGPDYIPDESEFIR